ncbi:hypothetical protein D3C85_1094890 [compost metagenome]
MHVVIAGRTADDAEFVVTGYACVTWSGFQPENGGLIARLRQFIPGGAITSRVTGTGNGSSQSTGAATGATGCPVDGFIPEDDIEVAAALPDQLELKGI